MTEKETLFGSAIDHVRAPLFVPGTRPERFIKALESGADAVIIDLEDAVATSEKEAAREAVLRTLPDLPSIGCPVGLRTNSAATEQLAPDAALVTKLADHLDFLVLPEVQGIEDLRRLQQCLDVSQPVENTEARSRAHALPVLALIESSRGLLNAPAIAEFPSVRRLALGAADLSEEWEIEPSSEEREFDFARQHLVIASRAAGLDGPIDSPHMNIRDVEKLSLAMQALMGLGMKGKLCIHPQQVSTVRGSFVVSEKQYTQLIELVSVFEEAESAGESSVRLPSGDFVDYPVYRRALGQIQGYEQFQGS